MKLNHINLGVTEVPKTLAMFETYFGFRKQEDFPANEKMAFLLDDDNSLIALFKVSDVHYPKMFHIGFIQDKPEDILSIREKLVAGGFEPEEPREAHGRLSFYFQAPGGFTVEVDAFKP